MTNTFLTYEQLDALIASGVSVSLADSGRVLTVWASVTHGSLYAWNELAQSFQFVRGAFRTEAR